MQKLLVKILLVVVALSLAFTVMGPRAGVAEAGVLGLSGVVAITLFVVSFFRSRNRARSAQQRAQA
ncbi:hypothetical protein [Streptomyces sp. NPDC047097]|uniref:hypothetical protein n=1 Tax=Streptomyces sp. NPDC047097 TaxID=3155260 RepID=UPI0033CA8412